MRKIQCYIHATADLGYGSDIRRPRDICLYADEVDQFIYNCGKRYKNIAERIGDRCTASFDFFEKVLKVLDTKTPYTKKVEYDREVNYNRWEEFKCYLYFRRNY